MLETMVLVRGSTAPLEVRTNGVRFDGTLLSIVTTDGLFFERRRVCSLVRDVVVVVVACRG